MTTALEVAICAELLRDQCEEALTMLLRYPDVFHLQGEPLGQTDRVQHKIDVEGVWPIHWLELMEEELLKMLSYRVIEPIEPWVSPVLLMQKKSNMEVK